MQELLNETSIKCNILCIYFCIVWCIHLPRNTKSLYVHHCYNLIISSFIDTHSVCSVCLAELPEELRRLSAVVCQRDAHSTNFKRGFRWLTPLNAIVRPTPFNVFRMSERRQRYRNNHSYQSCNARRKGFSRNMCIFPHSTVEEQWWNKWQEKGIDELALTQVAKQFYIKSRNGVLLSGVCLGVRFAIQVLMKSNDNDCDWSLFQPVTIHFSHCHII